MLRALLDLTDAYPGIRGSLTVPLDEFVQLQKDLSEYALGVVAATMHEPAQEIRIRRVSVRPQL